MVLFHRHIVPRNGEGVKSMVEDLEYRGWTLSWLSDGRRWYGLLQRDGWPDLKYDRYLGKNGVVQAMKQDVDRMCGLRGQPVAWGQTPKILGI